VDIKIDQKALVQQVLGMNPGKNIVIINMANTINESKEDSKNTLWDIIRTLPEPRMETIKDMVYEAVTANVHGSTVMQASFLGVSIRTLSDWKKGNKEKTEFERIEYSPPLELNP
jgi:hypothetical protein